MATRQVVDKIRRLQRAEDVHEAGRCLAVAANFRFLDEAADEEHQRRGRDTDPEQRAPGVLLRQHGDQQRVEQRRGTPADRPAGLHDANRSAAIAVSNHLAHQHRAGGPFATEAQALQCAKDKQLVEVLRKTAQEGEERIPHDGDLEYAHATPAIRQSTGKPTAERGYQQRDGAEYAGLTGGDVPQAQQARDDEREYLHIERVERPAAEAGDHGPAFARCQVREPGKHDDSSLACLGRLFRCGLKQAATWDSPCPPGRRSDHVEQIQQNDDRDRNSQYPK
jgi:hypothetical protein